MSSRRPSPLNVVSSMRLGVASRESQLPPHTCRTADTLCTLLATCVPLRAAATVCGRASRGRRELHPEVLHLETVRHSHLWRARNPRVLRSLTFFFFFFKKKNLCLHQLDDRTREATLLNWWFPHVEQHDFDLIVAFLSSWSTAQLMSILASCGRMRLREEA